MNSGLGLVRGLMRAEGLSWLDFVLQLACRCCANQLQLHEPAGDTDPVVQHHQIVYSVKAMMQPGQAVSHLAEPPSPPGDE